MCSTIFRGSGFCLSMIAFLSSSHWVAISQTANAQTAKMISATENVQSVANGEKESDDRIEKLSAYLSGTRWSGQFTITGEDAKPPAPEYYEILEATKGESGDYWNLVARIKYGDKDTTLPLPPIEIKWAGETPVITVDRVTIPGFGTFDARVLIRKGQYAGTWSHDRVGGHLFGKIEKMESENKPTPAKADQ